MIPYSNSSNAIFSWCRAIATLRPLLLADELVELAVQPLGVDRVDRVLHDLQPVAVDTRVIPTVRIARSATKPSRRGISGAGSGPR